MGPRGPREKPIQTSKTSIRTLYNSKPFGEAEQASSLHGVKNPQSNRTDEAVDPGLRGRFNRLPWVDGQVNQATQTRWPGATG